MHHTHHTPSAAGHLTTQPSSSEDCPSHSVPPGLLGRKRGSDTMHLRMNTRQCTFTGHFRTQWKNMKKLGVGDPFMVETCRGVQFTVVSLRHLPTCHKLDGPFQLPELDGIGKCDSSQSSYTSGI